MDNNSQTELNCIKLGCNETHINITLINNGFISNSELIELINKYYDNYVWL